MHSLHFHADSSLNKRTMPILKAEALARPRLSEARAPSAREQSRSVFQTRPKSLALNPDLPASSSQHSLARPAWARAGHAEPASRSRGGGWWCWLVVVVRVFLERVDCKATGDAAATRPPSPPVLAPGGLAGPISLRFCSSFLGGWRAS